MKKLRKKMDKLNEKGIVSCICGQRIPKTVETSGTGSCFVHYIVVMEINISIAFKCYDKLSTYTCTMYI